MPLGDASLKLKQWRWPSTRKADGSSPKQSSGRTCGCRNSHPGALTGTFMRRPLASGGNGSMPTTLVDRASRLAPFRSFEAVLHGFAPHGARQAPHLLDPKLYEIANNPTLYPLVFKDVTRGNNMVFNTTCCKAHKGYDETTGLGELDFTQLALALGYQFHSLPPNRR
jgi:hypothetical protein